MEKTTTAPAKAAAPPAGGERRPAAASADPLKELVEEYRRSLAATYRMWDAVRAKIDGLLRPP